MAAALNSVLKRVGGLAGATFASRLLGFFREVLTASILGGGTIASAWSLAFMIPNLCRRVFGEGLLATVLIPMMTGKLLDEGVKAGLPKYFEYYNAFSLLVTICWLYIEILNLLSKRE